jgi:hypothetical protein
LQKDFSSKRNRRVYRARFSERERDLIEVQWTEKMIESQKHILFFDFLQKHFPSDNVLNIVKKNFVKEEKAIVNVPTYYLLLFQIPVRVANRVKKIQRNLLWGGVGMSLSITW